jgi:carboxypeptidase C (cathepsin A)
MVIVVPCVPQLLRWMIKINVMQYDVRHPSHDPEPPDYFIDYLNLATTQNALGVNLNYTSSSNDVYFAFQQTGDFVFPDFKEDVEMLLDRGIRVALMYGDADYVCNWYFSISFHLFSLQFIQILIIV